MMRYTASEKVEIIRLVEQSDVSVSRTLAELGIARSTFYNWYHRYQEAGYQGLLRQPQTHRFWNRIPDAVREQVVKIVLERPELSARELAYHITDHEGYFISESSVYRILKACDLLTSPVFEVVSAKDKFEHPTTRVNELWQRRTLSSANAGQNRALSPFDEVYRHARKFLLPMGTGAVHRQFCRVL